MCTRLRRLIPRTSTSLFSEDVDDGTLVHQLAHALTYLAGSKLPAGTLDPLAYEIGIPPITSNIRRSSGTGSTRWPRNSMSGSMRMTPSSATFMTIMP